MKETVVLLITGQKKRLEISSKLENIIQPLSKNYNVITVFSLSETNNFTNKHKYKHTFEYDKVDIESKFESLSYCMNDIVYPEFTINNEIVSMYDKQNNGKEYTVERAYNHIRQYYTLSSSWPVVEKLKPDLLIRIRDDTKLSDPIDLNKNLQLANKDLISSSKYPTKSIITSSHERWGGINDQYAIILKEAIEPYLNEPFRIYNSYKTNYLGGKFSNPEQFIGRVYFKNEINLYIQDIKLLIVGQTEPDIFVKK